MHDKHGLIQNRLKRVLVERIIPAIHTPLASLELTAWHVEGGQGEPVDPSVALPSLGTDDAGLPPSAGTFPAASARSAAAAARL